MESKKKGVEMNDLEKAVKDATTSYVSGFYKWTVDERIDYIRRFSNLSGEHTEILHNSFPAWFPKQKAAKFMENCIGFFGYGMGLIANARINGKEYMIPLISEEPSIVAAASRAFGMVWPEGVEAESLGNTLRGMIYIKGLEDPEWAGRILAENSGQLLQLANRDHKYTRAHGYDIEYYPNELVFYLLVDTLDVQGANVVNKMCELVGPAAAELVSGRMNSAILSNHAMECLARSTIRVTKTRFARPNKGWPDWAAVLEEFMDFYTLGELNQWRATTNNKGIMNGVDGVGFATGQDTRALEAAAHSYAASTGLYRPLTEWEEDGDYVVGTTTLPIPVGTVRGATIYPHPPISLAILNNPNAVELQAIMAAVAGANNLAALQTVVTDGICQEHCALHDQRFEETGQ